MKNTRICTSCKVEKTITMFDRDKRFLSGRNEVCITCTSNISFMFFDKNIKQKIKRESENMKNKNTVKAETPIKREKYEYDKSYTVKDNLELGKSHSFIQSLRNQRPDKYKQYREYGNDNFIKGYKKIWEEYNEKLEEFSLVYYYVKETKKMKMGDFYARSRTCTPFVFGKRMEGVKPNDPFLAVRQLKAVTKGLIEEAREWAERIS